MTLHCLFKLGLHLKFMNQFEHAQKFSMKSTLALISFSYYSSKHFRIIYEYLDYKLNDEFTPVSL